MVCLYCRNAETRVINSRDSKKTPSVWRRRRCPECRTIITTYERIAEKELPLVESPEGTSRFSIPRLMVSIYTEMLPASHHRADSAMELAKTIAEKIAIDQPSPLTTRAISEVAHATLTAYSRALGMRYGLSQHLVDITASSSRSHKKHGGAARP